MSLNKSKLYKYRPFNERVKDILINNEIWCSHASTFNDPFEFSIKIELPCNPSDPDFRELFLNEYHESLKILYHKKKLTHSEYIKILTEIPHISDSNLVDGYHSMNNLLSDIGGRAIELAKDKFRVLSLSQSNDHPLLWGHYADGVRGVCIEFDFTETELPILEVLYSDTPPTVYSNEFNANNKNISCLSESAIANNLFRYKHKSWRYEREARLLATPKDLENGKNILKLNNGEIKSVIIGDLMSSENKKTIISIAKERNIHVYIATPIISEYKIEINKLL